MKKVKLHSRISLWHEILITLFLALCIYTCWFLRNEFNSFYLVIFLSFSICYTLYDIIKSRNYYFDKTVYASEILIYDECLEIIYKSANKTVKKEKIYKTNIKRLYLCVYFDTLYPENPFKRMYVSNFQGLIYLNNSDKIFEFGTIPPYSTPQDYSLQRLFNTVAMLRTFPNFELEINNANESMEVKLEYIRRFGKQ